MTHESHSSGKLSAEEMQDAMKGMIMHTLHGELSKTPNEIENNVKFVHDASEAIFAKIKMFWPEEYAAQEAAADQGESKSSITIQVDGKGITLSGKSVEEIAQVYRYIRDLEMTQPKAPEAGVSKEELLYNFGSQILKHLGRTYQEIANKDSFLNANVKTYLASLTTTTV